MKSLFVIMFALICAMPAAHAAVSMGQDARVVLSASNSLGSVAWTPVIASTTKGAKGIAVFSTATVPVEVGVALAGQASTAFVGGVIVPQQLSSVGSPTVNYYPTTLGYGYQLGLRSANPGAGALAGEVQISVVY